ncbi:MAG: hypothetical protein KC431_18725, partial [Myxococcales bacterium]|nr:hypothetical protein [Myxococcales bacterium]
MARSDLLPVLLAGLCASCFVIDESADDVAATETETDTQSETTDTTTETTDTTTETTDTTDTTETDAGPGCGNGVIEQGEACDGDNFAGNSCEQLGYAGGTLVCTDECTLDTSGCTTGCAIEPECVNLKPNVTMIVDYSTSMNGVMDAGLTRWEVVTDALEFHLGPASWLDANAHLSLIRYGHDPAPADAGTTIPNDDSGLVDGHRIDVEWFDGQNPWFECNGAAIVDALAVAG